MVYGKIILMKKKDWQAGFAPVIIIIFVTAILGTLTLLYFNKGPTQTSKPSPIEPTKVTLSVEEAAKEVVNLLKDKNFEELSNFVHPTKGIRFSPYTYVNLEKDLVFKKEEIKNLNLDPKKYTWGAYDGSGFPINLTFSEYYKKFIYDKDFALTKQISVNRRVGQGNTINNIPEAYPKASYVEFYVPGSSEMEGMDWGSLRLVFEQVEGKWYLVGIVHNQWTI